MGDFRDKWDLIWGALDFFFNHKTDVYLFQEILQRQLSTLVAASSHIGDVREAGITDKFLREHEAKWPLITHQRGKKAAEQKVPNFHCVLQVESRRARALPQTSASSQQSERVHTYIMGLEEGVKLTFSPQFLQKGLCLVSSSSSH